MGALLACNTWAGDFLISTTIPGVVALYLSDGQNEEDLVHDFDVALDQASMFYTVFRLAILVLIVTFVTVERNHLMAFAVFTPKFVFESIGQSIGDAILLFGIAACTASLKKWNTQSSTPHERVLKT